MMVVNSVCGCAAGNIKRGPWQSVMALQHGVKPDKSRHCFLAGGDGGRGWPICGAFLADFPAVLAFDRAPLPRW